MTARLAGRLTILAVASLLASGAWAQPPASAGAQYAGLQPDVFLTRWHVLGPIPVAGPPGGAPDEKAQKSAFDADLLVSCGGEARLGTRPAPVCTVAGQPYRLTAIEVERDVVDLASKLGKHDNSVAYAVAMIDVPSVTKAITGLGSDDAVKVWLNGKLVHQNWTQRALEKDQDLVPLELRPGKNTLVLKIQNGSGDWSFAVRALGPGRLEEFLWRAARAGEIERLEKLLQLGPSPNVNAKAKYGLTPWQIAKISGRADAATRLAESGADTGLSLPSPADLVDQILAAATQGRSPGAAVLVTRDGQTLFQRGYGYASIENQVKVSPATKFRIGSITKQFTAAAILRLQELGKLSVNDPLSKHMPDFPKGDAITLHHLLTHTSGLHSYTNKPDFITTVSAPIKAEDLIQSFKNDPPDFAPGERWAYCNSGYFLLGQVIEKVSGLSYGDFLRAQFFEPLSMKDTGVHTYDAILDNEATGYSQDGAALKKALNWDMSRAGGAGALYSTVGDLARWNEGVFGGKVLTEASLKAALTPVSLGGAQTPPADGYGYGWAVSTFRGLREIQHGGGLQGFLSQLARYPSERLNVVVLVNAGPPAPGLAPDELARDIAQIFLGDKMAAQRTPKAIALSPEALESFVGSYDYGGAVMTVTRESDRLFAQLAGQPKFEIFAQSENEFFWKVVDAKVRFVKDAAGRVVKAIHHQGPGTIEAPRIEEQSTVQVAAEKLEAYVGKYDYGQGRVVMTVTREGGQLFAQLTGQPKFEIFPVAENQFTWKVVQAKITFAKDTTGRVTGGIHEQAGQKLNVPRID